jgi:hypothetical protein
MPKAQDNDPVKKEIFVQFFWPRDHACHGRLFPLYYTASNLSREKLYKNQKVWTPEFVHFAMLTFGVGCGILSLSRGEAIRKGQRSQRVRFSKKSKKPLDKPLKMWYNVRAVKGKSPQGTP